MLLLLLKLLVLWLIAVIAVAFVSNLSGDTTVTLTSAIHVDCILRLTG